MVITYKVVKGKVIRPKSVPSRPFDINGGDTLLSENIIERMTDTPAVVAAQNRYIDLQKSERRTLWIGFGASLLMTTGIHFTGLTEAQSINWKGVIDTWFLVAAGVLIVLAFVALITRENDNIKSMPTKKILIESEGILEAYFNDFVKEIAAGEGCDTNLTEVTQFKVRTQSNDKRLHSREILLWGALNNIEHVTATTVHLRFNSSYTNLYVHRYDVTDSI